MNHDTQARELLACPFCGGEAQIEPKNWCGRDYVGVFCVECSLFMDSRAPDEAGAIATWNARAAISPAATSELSEQLTRAIFDYRRDMDWNEDEAADDAGAAVDVIMPAIRTALALAHDRAIEEVEAAFAGHMPGSRTHMALTSLREKLLAMKGQP